MDGGFEIVARLLTIPKTMLLTNKPFLNVGTVQCVYNTAILAN